MTTTRNSRRAGFAAALLFSALLAACQSMSPAGSADGQNGTGASRLAAIRSDAGLPPLAADSGLEQAALEQARLMAGAGAMNHTARFGKGFARRVRGNGIPGAAAENIAHGAFGPDELFQRWMNSPPHRRNMLNPSYRRFGLASAADSNGGGRRYWALVLAD